MTSVINVFPNFDISNSEILYGLGIVLVVPNVVEFEYD